MVATSGAGGNTAAMAGSAGRADGGQAGAPVAGGVSAGGQPSGGAAGSGGAGSAGVAGSAGDSAEGGAPAGAVGLYRTFEKSLENTKTYGNKFTDVTLRAKYTSPSGKQTELDGFFDGDGAGGGNKTSGNVWKLRYLADELGTWHYEWTWSDGSPGGADDFTVVNAGAGKGVLRPYKDNPRWLAYNGSTPVWLKSYYESAHRGIGQPLDWMVQNVYQPLIDNGYNHLQVDWLFPLCCSGEYYTDGPAQTLGTRALYEEGKASSTLQLDIWHLLEQHLRWLNDKNVGLHMFLGFDGGQNAGPAWDKLSASEQDFYVRYVVARLAPYANIAGWNFTWEVDGNREAYELGWARLVKKYDVFNHLRAYHDETPGTNEYQRAEYTFAAVENHQMVSTDKTLDRPHWLEPGSHHAAALAGYVTGKPVYMTEGNALWRRYWGEKLGGTADVVGPAAWGCATAAASFTWCGHTSTPLTVRGAGGLPFFGDDNPYRAAAKAVDVLADVMSKKLAFFRMTPQDGLLSGHDKQSVFCLAEAGHQYLVFAAAGKSFSLNVASGKYTANEWVDTKTGATTSAPAIDLGSAKSMPFSAPNTTTAWALLLRDAAP